MNYPVFSGVDTLPGGHTSDHLVEGCLVLEGGAFRGVYTSGVLDALMEADINLSCTIGISAGALNGCNYVSGQIGRSARINLRYRHDPRYVGTTAWRRNHGIIGFDFVFGKMEQVEDFDQYAFDCPERRFIAAATSCRTGQLVYFEKGRCGDIRRAIQASASMPYVSRPVVVDGEPCLDGGCASKIPLEWALESGYEKIVVVRTRDDAYRRKETEKPSPMAKAFYGRRYPALTQALARTNRDYNLLCGRMKLLQKAGRVFVIRPSTPVTAGRLEKDMEALGALYYQGYQDTQAQLDELRTYLDGNGPERSHLTGQ